MATVIPCCPGVLEPRLARRDAATLAMAFKALADPGHLGTSVGLSQPTVSHHLKRPHAADLIDREKRGAWVYYRVVPERLAMLAGAPAVGSVRRRRGARRRRSAR